MLDNAFVEIADWSQAQQLAELSVQVLHKALDRFAKLYCPVADKLGESYHWSIMQVKYAADIVFARQDELQAIYGNLTPTANDVTFFKHHRREEQRDGGQEFKLAPVRKTIYSFQPDLLDLIRASTLRYLDFISEVDDPSSGTKALNKISASVEENGRTYKSFNLFAGQDQRLFETIVLGEFNISGMRNADLRSAQRQVQRPGVAHPQGTAHARTDQAHQAPSRVPATCIPRRPRPALRWRSPQP